MVGNKRKRSEDNEETNTSSTKEAKTPSIRPDTILEGPSLAEDLESSLEDSDGEKNSLGTGSVEDSDEEEGDLSELGPESFDEQEEEEDGEDEQSDEFKEFRFLQCIDIDAKANDSPDAKSIGYCYAKLIDREPIRVNFYRDMEEPTNDMSMLAFEVFDRWGCLKSELQHHQVKKGTNA